MSSTAYTFRDRIVLHDNQPLATLNSAGTTRSNLIIVTSGVTNLTGVPGNSIFINNGVTSSTLLINNTVGNSVVIRSKLAVGAGLDTALLTANITLQKGGYIGNNSSSGSTDSFTGLSGGFQMDAASGSRIVLRGNTVAGSAGNLELYTGNSTSASLRLYSGNDSLKLQLMSTGTFLFTPDGSTTALSIGSTTSSLFNQVLLQNATQSAGVGSGGSLTVLGGASISKDVYIGGTMTSSSDARLKENITELTGDYLDLIHDIRTVHYNMIGVDQKEYGFIAQDFVKSFPDLVRECGYYSLDYQKTNVILLKCIKELYERVKELERRQQHQ